MDWSSGGGLAKSEREIPTRIFVPVCGDELGHKLRHNEQMYELFVGPDIVKYIKFIR
jgi:hypothetical protein